MAVKSRAVRLREPVSDPFRELRLYIYIFLLTKVVVVVVVTNVGPFFSCIRKYRVKLIVEHEPASTNKVMFTGNIFLYLHNKSSPESVSAAKLILSLWGFPFRAADCARL